MKTVYTYDQTGEYTGELELDEGDLSPLEAGKYLIPAGATEEAPPAEIGQGNGVFFKHGQWIEAPLLPIEVDTDGDGVPELIDQTGQGYEQEPEKAGFWARVVGWIKRS